MGILEALVSLITQLISQTSYFGITGLMTLESANIPIPSEVILPFSGFLAGQNSLNFWLVVVSGTLGCTIGSIASYYLGRLSDDSWIHRFVRGPGRVLISNHELETGERWLSLHGDLVVLISRLLPIVRTFISFPAGMAKVNFLKFVFYTTVGSLIWSIFLTWIGYNLGENWNSLEPVFRQFDYLIIVTILIGLVWFLYHRGKRLAQH